MKRKAFTGCEKRKIEAIGMQVCGQVGSMQVLRKGTAVKVSDPHSPNSGKMITFYVNFYLLI